MPELSAILSVPPVSTGIGDARRFTRNQLESWGLVDLIDTTLLMVSELVTNAILHGGAGAELTLRLSDSRLRAEVRDGNPSAPVVRNYSDTATTGRGMIIVDALAAEWGAFAAGDGKVVWFELEAPGNGHRAFSQAARSSTPGANSLTNAPRPQARSTGAGDRRGPSSRAANLCGAGSGR